MISLYIICNRIREAIYEDNFFRSVFHIRHIDRSDRLKNGVITYTKKKEIYTQLKYENDRAAVLLARPEESYPGAKAASAGDDEDDDENRYA